MATIIAQEIPGPDSKDYDSEDTYMFEGPRQLAGPIFEFRYPTSAPNDGKACIQQQERDNATNNRSSLLFGELAPMGVTKMFDQEHLRAGSCKTLYDLGMGCGKLILQAFEQFPTLEHVVGVELSESRYGLALKNFNSFVRATSNVKIDKTKTNKRRMVINATHTMKDGSEKIREMEIEKGNMWARTDAFEADIVVMETQIPGSSHQTLCNFLHGMKSGARLLTYENVEEIYGNQKGEFPIPCPFDRLPNNDFEDRFFTSWAQKRGHRFHLWERK